MPVGDDIKGRFFNVTGDPIEGLPAVSEEKWTADSQQTTSFRKSECYNGSFIYRYQGY